MVDFALQRTNMVEGQVRPSDVTDRRILRAMLEVPRERFAAPEAQALAYMDERLLVVPARGGTPARYMMAPRVLAKLIQALELEAGDLVLDVGAGTGYASAVLARIVRAVVALESEAAVAEIAKATLSSLGVANVKFATGALAEGVASEAPYDAILVNGAVPDVPAALLDQLKDGGRLAAVVVANDSVGRAVQWRRLGGTFDARPLFDAAAPRLPGFERKAEFVF
ncbi:MAG TPA: protein-L-isoaspartate O-methyltransferase [Hyphomicrobiaceae bacterium]|nr:protein-L-isoaspartate O-methyltransferase [Hyphomicrobiaceae bacterium]